MSTLVVIVAVLVATIIVVVVAKRAWIRRHVLGSAWLDMIVPWDSPLSQEETESKRQREANQLAETRGRIQDADCETLKMLMPEVTALMEVEAERRRSVDTRLATIVGLASVAATIATGLIVAQAAGTLKFSNIYGRWVLSALAFYIVMQLCDAIYWAVRGQARHGYRSDTVEDILPKRAVAEEELLRQRIITWVEQLHFNQNSTNSKVTAMAVAHQAAKNFAGSLVVLSLIAMFTMALAPMTAPVLEQARADAVRDLLRGPAGPEGPQGQAGPVGRIGPRGPKGEAAPAGTVSKHCQCATEPKH